MGLKMITENKLAEDKLQAEKECLQKCVDNYNDESFANIKINLGISRAESEEWK